MTTVGASSAAAATARELKTINPATEEVINTDARKSCSKLYYAMWN
jgi:hypothetical protein